MISRHRNRAPAYIQLVPDFQGTARHTRDFLGAEARNDRAPLADGSRADIDRPRDIRGVLKVIENFRLEHAGIVTAVQSEVQPQSKNSVLTSVHMDKLQSLAERLSSAMGEAVSASDLARACGVSPAAVSKWLDGRTKALTADNYAAAARALGVREEWLRTGKLPRERDGAEEDRQMDRVISILEDLRGPLAALLSAIEALGKGRARAARKRSA